MKDSTKRLLLGIGGASLGIVAASTGGALIGTALAGILIRTGVLKPSPAFTKEAVKALTSTSNIFRGMVSGAIVSVAGVRFSADQGAKIGEALEDKILEAKADVSIVREDDIAIVIVEAN